MTGPLEGVKAIEVCQVMSGPFCGLLLADMGADVIKVERPGGDDSRKMAPPWINGESAAFLAINRNKRGIGVNLKTEEGRQILRKLAAQSDILIENFRPGVMESLGLGFESLAGINPSLIYCSISGFGQTGPYRSRGGFDLVAQAMSGLMSVTGEPGRPPVKVGVPVADLNAGMYACYGILSAYIHRLKTGKGQLVDTSLLEAGIAYTFWESAFLFATGQNPPPTGSAHRLSAPYQAFKTSDGYIAIGAANQSNWKRLCDLLGRPDLLEDSRFITNAVRVKNQGELTELLSAAFAKQTTIEWLTLLEAAGVPAGPVYSMDQVYQDPQVISRQMIAELNHPMAGQTRVIGLPVKLSESPGSIRRSAPLLGQHTDEVLKECGFGSEEIAQLREGRAIF